MCHKYRPAVFLLAVFAGTFVLLAGCASSSMTPRWENEQPVVKASNGDRFTVTAERISSTLELKVIAEKVETTQPVERLYIDHSRTEPLVDVGAVLLAVGEATVEVAKVVGIVLYTVVFAWASGSGASVASPGCSHSGSSLRGR